MTSNSYCVRIKQIPKYTHGDTTLQIFPLLFLYIALNKSYLVPFASWQISCKNLCQSVCPSVCTFVIFFYVQNLFGKSKGIPDLLDFRHYKGGRSSAKRTGRLYPRRKPWYSFSEAESSSGHMGLSEGPRKKSQVTPPGIDPGTFRLVAQRLNHYATPGPYKIW